MSWTGTERLGMELGEWGKERGYQGALGRGLGTRAKVLPKYEENNQVMSQTTGTERLSPHFEREENR